MIETLVPMSDDDFKNRSGGITSRGFRRSRPQMKKLWVKLGYFPEGLFVLFIFFNFFLNNHFFFSEWLSCSYHSSISEGITIYFTRFSGIPKKFHPTAPKTWWTKHDICGLKGLTNTCINLMKIKGIDMMTVRDCKSSKKKTKTRKVIEKIDGDVVKSMIFFFIFLF